MKKIKLSGKLSLNKKAIAQLNANEQKAIIGGLADDGKKTETGSGMCTARETLFCCNDKTKTGPAVCTAMVTFACCDGRG